MIYELLVVALEASISQYISPTRFPTSSTQLVSIMQRFYGSSGRLEFPTRPPVLTDVIISIEFKMLIGCRGYNDKTNQLRAAE